MLHKGDITQVAITQGDVIKGLYTYIYGTVKKGCYTQMAVTQGAVTHRGLLTEWALSHMCSCLWMEMTLIPY